MDELTQTNEDVILNSIEIEPGETEWKFPRENDATKDSKSSSVLISFCYFMIFCQFLGWWEFGSILILVDACHLAFQVFKSISTTLLTLSLSKNDSGLAYSFGYQRTHVLGTFFSVFFGWVLGGLMVCWSISRMVAPVELPSKEITIMGFASLFGNLIIRWVRDALKNRKQQHNGVSQKEHPLFGEIAVSICIIVLGILLSFSGKLALLDSVLALMFSVYRSWAFVPVFKGAIYILMEGTPESALKQNIRESFKGISEVEEVHDFHCWSLSEQKSIISSHILTNEPKEALKKITKVCRQLGINQSTIQLEVTKDKKSDKFVNCAHNLHD